MSRIPILASVVLFSVFAATVVIRARSTARWIRAADQLARRYDIGLTPEVAGLVARKMRTEYLLTAALTVPLFIFVGLPFSGTVVSADGVSSYAAVVLFLPMLVIVTAGLLSVPGWNSASGQRVSHLVRARIGQLFTRPEWLAVGAGVAVTMIAVGWGFWRVDAGAWWTVWPLTAVVSGVAWWMAVRAIVQRPARAGDVVELGWDDVFRYRDARNLTIAAAWAPAAVAVLLLDFSLEPDGVDLIPFYGTVVVAVVLNQVFQRGDSQWRKVWS